MATYNNRYQSGGNPPPTVPTYNGGGGGQPPRRRQSGPSAGSMQAYETGGAYQNIGTSQNYYGGGSDAGAGNYTTEGWASNLPGINGNMGTVNTPGAPTHMDTGPVPPPGGGEEQGPPDGYDPDELAAMITQLFGDQLGQGPRDTTEDEELIRQMMAGQVGGNLADLNARMGGMGFGDSGAAMNLSGDIYQRGARQASEDIMGLRQRSRDDYQDQIAQAAQILAGERQLGMSEDYYSAIQEYINSLSDDGQGDGQGEEDTSVFDAMNLLNWINNPADTAMNYANDALEMITGSESDLPSGTDILNQTLGAGGGVQFIEDPSQVPEGFTPLSDEPTFLPGIGQGIVYFGPDGNGGTQVYVVRS